MSTTATPASILRLILTPECNLECMYCHNEGFDRGRNDFTALSLPDFEKTAALLKNHGVSSVCLTGGEPLINESFADILTIVTDIFGGANTHVSTNGLFLDKFLDLMNDLNVSRINVSCDAVDPSTYKQITRWDGFDQVVGNINKALKYNFFVNVNCVMLNNINTNRDYIISMLDFWRNAGARLSFLRLCFPFHGLKDLRYDMNNLISLFDSMGLVSHLTRHDNRPPTLCYTYHGREVALRYYVPDRSNQPCIECKKRDMCSEGLYHPRLGLNGVLRSCILREELSIDLKDSTSIDGPLAEFLGMFDAVPDTWVPADFDSP